MVKKGNIQVLLCITTILLNGVQWICGAVVPPPWADPKVNPCASQPGGWQLLYWPPDGKCYKIFQIGYPCPDGMELTPGTTKSGEKLLSAECRCPPQTAQSTRDGRCYKLFSLGPCEKGWYFAPDVNVKYAAKRQWGTCKQLKKCPQPSLVFWPKDRKCYSRLTRGPCSHGQLLIVDSDKLPACKCGKTRELRDYRFADGQCYQHFTKGPCKEKGHLFLPDRTCGCHSFLPHFHAETEACYEFGTIGPCGLGEIFQPDPETRLGGCRCKSGYIRYRNESSCYRPYTEGPCESHHILVNATTCLKQPCKRGYLYFPEKNECYRIGTRGPCQQNRVVTFDFSTRPSVDGVSYNGVCGCENDRCPSAEASGRCEKGWVKFKDKCYRLYSRGPCPEGAWLGLRRSSSGREGICECMPGYDTIEIALKGDDNPRCASPTVILANYLNRSFKTVQTVDS